jgi:hypothetical protein
MVSSVVVETVVVYAHNVGACGAILAAAFAVAIRCVFVVQNFVHEVNAVLDGAAGVRHTAPLGRQSFAPGRDSDSLAAAHRGHWPTSFFRSQYGVLQFAQRTGFSSAFAVRSAIQSCPQTSQWHFSAGITVSSVPMTASVHLF